MGTQMAPSYAIIYMDKIERELMNDQKTCTKFLRYIDDILIFYEHGEEELLKLMEHSNEAHPSIKFTYEYSRESINFLDMKIIKNRDGTIETDLFKKATDAHAYLHYNSCHHTQQNHYHIPKHSDYARSAPKKRRETHASKR